jgi:phospholipase/lecithinase/hemolysin
MMVVALPASAQSERAETARFHRFGKLVVFGDSLSDTGNVFAMTAGTVPAPSRYYAGRFSNGPVWVEYLGDALDLPFENYAYGGALTDNANLFDGVGGLNFPGLRDEIHAYTQRPEGIDRRAIHVVWAGANDFRAALSKGQTPDIHAMIGNLLEAVDTLYAAGARYIVVSNLPDLGLTPEGLASGVGPFITLLSATFNEYLAAALAVHPAGVVQIDVFQQMHDTISHPEEYGFVNVSTPCLMAASVCAEPDTYLFWDHVHPTTRGHEVLAETFAKAIEQTLVKRDRLESL